MGVGLAIIGATAAIGGAWAQNAARRRQAEAQEEAADIQAAHEIQNAKFDARRIRERGEEVKRKQLSQMGGSGVATTSGSFTHLREETERRISTDEKQRLKIGRQRAAQIQAGAEAATAGQGAANFGTFLQGVGTAANIASPFF